MENELAAHPAVSSCQADADTVFYYQRLPGLLQEYEDRASSPSGEGVPWSKHVETCRKVPMPTPGVDSIPGGGSINGGVPKIGWLVRGNPIKIDDLGVSLFQETQETPIQTIWQTEYSHNSLTAFLCA